MILYKISLVEYSDEYKEWLNLSEEERKNTLEPRKYDIVVGTKDDSSYLTEVDNLFKVQQLLKANLSDEYDLREVIPDNVKIRNQMDTNSCWAFATIGALESHLALRDKKANKPIVAYDFSEKHMNYATAREAFLNNQTNPYGYHKKVSDGGNIYNAIQYMANGLGAIEEKDLPFVNSEENIDIAEIQNKEVKTTLYDTVEFEQTAVSDRETIIPKIKEHIVNYGGVYAGVHGAAIFGDSYNNETGAMYCKSSIFEPMNHAVVIIGWDDNYSKENFNENQRPSEDGAWIIKNSWGESIAEDLLTIKQALFEAQQEECEGQGWYSPEEIPNDVILALYQEGYGKDKVSIQGEELVIEIGNKGYMYISYEDCNVYQYLVGIEKATNSKDYKNVYQNDTLGPNKEIALNSSDNIYLANVFTRDASLEEALDKVSIYTFRGYTCKVWVNPNNDSKNKSDFQEVQLKEGDSETIEPGYRTLEFAQPIKLTGDSFVVVIEIINDASQVGIALEGKDEDGMWQTAEVNVGESFCATEADWNNNLWTDMVTLENEQLRGNLCIKAYTTSNTSQENVLSEIYIKTPPTKTAYMEGENFDKTGMTIMAQYSDGTEKEITTYEITDGENLTKDRTEVTIKYTEGNVTKTVKQEITVQEKEDPTDPEEPVDPDETILTGIAIKTPPTKTAYMEGENFDKTGMTIMAQYSDGTEKEITTYEITDGENLTKDRTEVTIKYTEGNVTKTAKQAITVQAKTEPTLSDFSKASSAITDAKLYFDSQNLEKASSVITIKVTGIKLGDVESNCTYEYHIAGVQGEKEITDWKETKEAQENDGTYSLTFTVKSEELQNWQEIIESDKLYIYIKEQATIDDQKKEQIVTLEIKNQTEPKCYIDGKYVGTIEDVLNYNKDNNQNNNSNADKPNTAPGTIPKAGKIAFMIGSIVAILAIGGFAFYRYKNIDR